MAKIAISFYWIGHCIDQFIDFNLLKDDLNKKDDFWGEFIYNGIEYQYQIWWDTQQIVIFNKGGVEPISHIDNFHLSFSNTFTKG